MESVLTLLVIDILLDKHRFLFLITIVISRLQQLLGLSLPVFQPSDHIHVIFASAVIVQREEHLSVTRSRLSLRRLCLVLHELLHHVLLSLASMVTKHKVLQVPAMSIRSVVMVLLLTLFLVFIITIFVFIIAFPEEAEGLSADHFADFACHIDTLSSCFEVIIIFVVVLLLWLLLLDVSLPDDLITEDILVIEGHLPDAPVLAVLLLCLVFVFVSFLVLAALFRDVGLLVADGQSVGFARQLIIDRLSNLFIFSVFEVLLLSVRLNTLKEKFVNAFYVPQLFLLLKVKYNPFLSRSIFRLLALLGVSSDSHRDFAGEDLVGF